MKKISKRMKMRADRMQRLRTKDQNVRYDIIDAYEESIFNRLLKALEPLGILLALIGIIVAYEQFNEESDSRADERLLNAWQIVTSTDSGTAPRREAYYRLINAGESFRGVDFSCSAMTRKGPDFCRHDHYDLGIRSFNGIGESAVDKVILRDVDFTRNRFFQVYFGNIEGTGIIFNDSNFDTVTFDQSYLPEARFENAQLLSTRIIGGNLSAVKFTNSHIEESTFQDAILRGAQFQNSTIRATVFKDITDFGFSDFRKAKISFTDFRNAKLDTADFRGSTLNYINFSGADLQVTNFFGRTYAADLQNFTTFDEAKFLGVNISGAKFDKSILKMNFTEESIWYWSDQPPEIIGEPNAVLQQAKVCDPYIRTFFEVNADGVGFPEDC